MTTQSVLNKSVIRKVAACGDRVSRVSVLFCGRRKRRPHTGRFDFIRLFNTLLDGPRSIRDNRPYLTVQLHKLM